MSYEQVKDLAGVLAKLQIHALLLTLAGGGLALAGHKDEGLMVLGAAMALFKGHPTQ